MKVALAQFIYESNTFNNQAADLEFFTQNGTWLTEPDAVRAWAKNSHSQMESSLTALEAAGWSTAPHLCRDVWHSRWTVIRGVLPNNS